LVPELVVSITKPTQLVEVVHAIEVRFDEVTPLGLDIALQVVPVLVVSITAIEVVPAPTA
jgi:hypothetical protein